MPTMLKDLVELSALDEAQRLWNGAERSFERGTESLTALCEAVDLGIRGVEILAIDRLRPVQGRYPATIGLLLEAPPAKVDPVRDTLHVPKALGILELLDMTSTDDLGCLSPKLHHGWEDRIVSCRRTRRKTRERLGVTLDAEGRHPLLLLAAYRNRIFRLPPPVVLDPEEIRGAFPVLRDLYQRLLACSATVI